MELNEKVKRIAYKLLLKKEIDSTPEFTDQKLWTTLKGFGVLKRTGSSLKRGKHLR